MRRFAASNSGIHSHELAHRHLAGSILPLLMTTSALPTQAPPRDRLARIFFFGSSSADIDAYPQLVRTALEDAGVEQVRAINAGIGGDTIEQMLTRIERDVLSRRPTMVVVQSGMTCAASACRPASEKGSARGRGCGTSRKSNHRRNESRSSHSAARFSSLGQRPRSVAEEKLQRLPRRQRRICGAPGEGRECHWHRNRAGVLCEHHRADVRRGVT
jgi:hypothetical protein